VVFWVRMILTLTHMQATMMYFAPIIFTAHCWAA
jgi:hypothetical protein